MERVEFRPARIDDAPRIASNIFPRMRPEDILDNLGRCLKEEHVHIILGVLEGDVVAHTQIDLMGSPRLHIARIYSFIVSEPFRGRGIGSMMMRHVEEWCRSQDIELLLLEVYPDNEEGLSFYRHHGFRRYGYLPRGSRFPDGTYKDEILMYKWIGE